VSILWLRFLDGLKNLLTINSRAALLNDSVADLSDEDDEAGRSIVVLGVVPDQQDGVHDGHELFCNIGQLL
jgi:hypothetical protein